MKHALFLMVPLINFSSISDSLGHLIQEFIWTVHYIGDHSADLFSDDSDRNQFYPSYK